jgi:ABC-type dipeptide/oligopeptide/nickel transport system permease component
VGEELLERFPRTFVLATASLALAIVLGLTAGVVAARRPGGVVDRLSVLFALTGISVPVFVSAILLVWLFAVTLRALPPSGWIADDPRALVLPAVTLGVRSAAMIARMTRASLLEVLSADYVRTSRAKGCAEPAVLLRHGLRNALIPVVTLVGLDFGSYLSGSVLTESIFAWPGVGQYAMQAILRRDFPAIQGTVLFLSAIFVAVNLAVDLAYGGLDPRMRRAWRPGSAP